MLYRFHKWLRVVLVSEWILWFGLACVLAVWLGHRLLIVWLSIFAPVLTEAEIRLVTTPAHFLPVLLFSAVYGLYRAATFHPVSNRSYGTWLAQTPWRYPQQLPLGPIALVWQDVVILAILLSPIFLPPYIDLHALYVPLILFLLTYCGYLAFVHWVLDLHWAWMLFLGLLVIGVVMIINPLALLAVGLLMYVVTFLGIASSLRDFPYTEGRRAKLGLVPFEQQSPPRVPWPVVPGEDHPCLRILRVQPTLLGISVGAVFFGAAFHFRHEPDFGQGMLFIHGLIALVSVLVRLFIYVSECRPPISLLGRFATGRLIIPGYDRVFVAPILTIFTAFILPHVLLWLGTPAVVAIPISTGVTLWLAFSLPPQFEEWYYTGHFRIPAVRRIGQDFVQT